jgi:multicomponent K+:H+ antiporter subunit E
VIGRLVPHPVVSVLLMGTWLALARSLAPLHAIGAFVIGLTVPFLTARLLGDPVAVARPLVALRLAAAVVLDIVVANVVVARLVLGPMARLRPGFVSIPLATGHEYANVLLANIVTMTPGSVSVEIDEVRGRLLLHVLDLGDANELVQRIKTRYERPILEVFGAVSSEVHE